MKIFLAGMDEPKGSAVGHRLGYPFRLCSYHYVAKHGDADRAALLEHSRDGSEWIMDSGLFTLMFGTTDGQRPKTEAEFLEYAKRYVGKMHEWGWRHAIVECDVQRLVGVDACERIREEVFWGCEIETIYVWHVPDGLPRLLEMVRSYGRIALSVPELRKVVGAHVKRALLHLLGEIRKAERPGAPVRVHLLGCTETKLLSLPADSGDSTSWCSGVRFGQGTVWTGAGIETANIRSPLFDRWSEMLEESTQWSARFAAIDEWANARSEGAQEWCRVNRASAIAYWTLMDSINRS